MVSNSTIKHLRIPFSIFLLPVYLFSLSISISNNPSFINVLLSFVIIHLFLYPASNGYNSYYDKDEGSIGGLEHPPEVKKDLYYTSIILDLAAIALGCLINYEFAFMLLVYGMISKAYSHPSIRIKKYPYVSWFIVGLFQGSFTFLMSYIGINNVSIMETLKPEIYLPGILTSLMLWGSYPMTQVYQHDEDRKRGDITLSLILGIRGTFIFTAVAFSIATAAFVLFFYTYYNLVVVMIYLVILTPVLLFFFSWYFKTVRDTSNANFKNTMRLNVLSSICLVLFFSFLAFYSYFQV